MPSPASPENSGGFILRLRPLTETSLIVHWLTPDLGRIATVAKGARRPKSPFRGKLDLCYECNFSFTRSRRSELHTLREVVLRHTHEPLRHELGWLQQATYAATLIEQTTETETPLPEIHALFARLLAHLPQQPPKPRTVFAFELKLLHELGLAPDPATTRLSAGARTLLTALIDSDWPQLAALQPTAAEVRALSQFLHGFLLHHLGRLPRPRAAALSGQ